MLDFKEYDYPIPNDEVELTDRESVPGELKNLPCFTQMIDAAIEEGVSDAEFLFVHAIFVDPFMLPTRAYLQLNPDADRSTALREATKLMATPRVRKFYNNLVKKRIDEDFVTEFEIVQNLRSVRDRCMEAEELRDKHGRPTGEYRFDSMAALKATELLGKHIGMFNKERLEISGPGGKPIQTIDSDMDFKQAAMMYHENLKGGA